MGTRTRVSKVKAPRLKRSSNGMLMTPEEFDAAADDDETCRYELIRGVLIVSPIPSEMGAEPVQELGYFLLRYREDHPAGSALDATLAEHYLKTSDGRRRADRGIWARCPTPRRISPPLRSNSRRDRVRDCEEKRREHLSLGIAEYRNIDRFRRIMTVHRRAAAGADFKMIPAQGTNRTPLLPRYELPLTRLLSAADRWKRSSRRLVFEG